MAAGGKFCSYLNTLIKKGRLKPKNQVSDDLLSTFLSEAVIHAQGKLAAALVEGSTTVAVGEALAVRTVLLVADVVDGEVDVIFLEVTILLQELMH